MHLCLRLSYRRKKMKSQSILFGLFLILLSDFTVCLSQAPFGLKENRVTSNQEKRSFKSSLSCHFYDDSIKPAGGLCSDEHWKEFGHCNGTYECDEPGHHCFMSWRNETGNVTKVRAGCWMKDLHCHEGDECRTTNDTGTENQGKVVYFCCCSGNLCNEKFYLDPATDVEATPEDSGNSAYNQWMILLYVLLPLVLVCAIILFTFYIYRLKTGSHDDLDNVSIDTPATANTRCPTEFFPTSIDSPSPMLIEVKARGRFGKVWRAQWGDRLVAVKTFNQSEKRSWQNEQEIFVTPLMNSHDNILKYLHASNRGEGLSSELWLITEFHDKGSLADYLKVHTVTLNEGLQIMRTMASGMSFLHEDIQTKNNDYKPAIAHRDFKSKNVLLDQRLNAVIADFGLARKFTPGECTGECHSQVGTVRYMAPEVLQGAITFQKDAFLRIDMYAFGLVLWEILTRSNINGECDEFKLPFEKELGTHPEMSEVQDWVSERKLRPILQEEWRGDKTLNTICDTIEECWDHDAEARLSAGCVEQRMAGLLLKKSLVTSTQDSMDDTSQLILPPTRVNRDEAMNQINLQLNNLNPGVNMRPMEGPPGPTSTSFSDTQKQDNQKQKAMGGTYVVDDDDHDSGTFANEDTLSHDGVMEQLIDPVTDDSGAPRVRVVNGDDVSTTSLLNDNQETDA